MHLSGLPRRPPRRLPVRLPMSTADDVWRWLLACTQCGDIHEFRRVDGARQAWTYRHPDGHPYLSRGAGSLGHLRQLHDQWQQEGQR